MQLILLYHTSTVPNNILLPKQFVLYHPSSVASILIHPSSLRCICSSASAMGAMGRGTHSALHNGRGSPQGSGGQSG